MGADPAWLAARAGLPGDSGVVNGASQIGQFLATHSITPVYTGTPAGASSTGGGVFYGTGGDYWPLDLGVSEFDQPFVLASGTSTGRVVFPVLPVGDGADLLVSLCADSSGSPGAVITQTRVPAAWIRNLAAVRGVPAGGTLALEATGSPLATAQSNSLAVGPATSVPWPTPAASGAANTATPAVAVSGSYIILAGGINASTNALLASVYTIAWGGGAALAAAVPQPSLPAAQVNGALAATTDTLVYAGGGTGGTYTDAVFTAPWDPSTGVVGAWSSQAALPQAMQPGGAAVDGETVYLAGAGVAGVYSNAVYWATVSNGQITGWNSGPPLPAALSQPNVMAAGGYLVVAGGVDAASGPLDSFYYAAINGDGSLGAWQAGPVLPDTSYDADGALQNAAAGSGLLVSDQNDFLAVGMDTAGPGVWARQKSAAAGNTAWAAFPTGAGTWLLFTMLPPITADSYYTLPLSTVPLMSVPLPATGLTSGATYHILLQQQGGDLNNYLAGALDTPATSGAAALYRAAGSSAAWAEYSAGQVIPLTVYDDTAAGSWPLHLWEDNGARVTSLVSAPRSGQLLGILEATGFGTGPLNSNAYFAGGSGAGWTGYQGTFTVTSTPPAGAPYPYAGVYVNNGTAAGAMEESAASFTVAPGGTCAVAAWVNSSVATVQAGVDWMDSSGTYLSTSVESFTVTPGVWTQITTGWLTSPDGAASAYPRVGDAAADGATIYAQAITVAGPVPGQVAAVTGITYLGSLPVTATQLA